MLGKDDVSGKVFYEPSGVMSRFVAGFVPESAKTISAVLSLL